MAAAISRHVRRAVSGLLFALAGGAGSSAQDLPTIDLSAGPVTVSGLSSGAYMAMQMHLAFAQDIAGAGIVAGGPYGCAQGSLGQALSRCLAPGDADAGPDVPGLERTVRERAADGRLAPLDALAGDRVHLFTGSGDRTVSPAVATAAAALYRRLGMAPDDLRVVTHPSAGHGLPVHDGPVPCDRTEPPYLIDCARDEAGEILDWLLGPAQGSARPPSRPLQAVPQTLGTAKPAAIGLGPTARLHVPEACARGARCRLHIVFHGCRQGDDFLGDAFATGAGFNRWADARDIVVLYPQIRASTLMGNPRGCWDWWGYTGPAYDTRQGAQIAAVARIARTLGAPLSRDQTLCAAHDGANWRHLWHGRLRLCGFGLCAVGTGGPAGGPFAVTRLFETAPGVFDPFGCPTGG